MFHDDIYEKMKISVEKDSQMTDDGRIFMAALLHSKPTVFYFNGRDIDEDLLETGIEFYNADVMRLPFDSVFYVIDIKWPDKGDFKGKIERTGFFFMRDPNNPNKTYIWLTLPHAKSYFVYKVSDECFKERRIEGSDIEILLMQKVDDEQIFIAVHGDEIHLQLAKCMMAFFGATMLLNTRYAEKERVQISEKLNKKRRKTGKPLLQDYTTISLRSYASNGAGKGGTHASPRPHWRRGHIRRYADGHVIPIAPILVNADLGEAAQKAYKVRK